MTLRYVSKPVGYSPQQHADPFARFPRHAQPIATAPAMGSRPIRVFSPDGKSQWAVHHHDGWRVVANVLDADGVRRVRMTGDNVSCPVAWASS
jgi:hypothetical protein